MYTFGNLNGHTRIVNDYDVMSYVAIAVPIVTGSVVGLNENYQLTYLCEGEFFTTLTYLYHRKMCNDVIDALSYLNQASARTKMSTIVCCTPILSKIVMQF